MKDMILSLVRSTLISVGSVYAAKKGLDGASIDAIVSALIALIAASWGAVEKLKKPE